MPESWFVARAKSRHSTAHRALAADLLGLVDLHQRRPGGADGEEQLGVGVPAEGTVTPAVVGGTEGEA